MKKLLLLILITLTSISYGQYKTSFSSFNKLVEVEGTEYVIALVEYCGKMSSHDASYLLFINTQNGQTHQVDIPNKGNYQKVEQIKIDKLGINCIMLSAKTVDLDGKKGIEWDDPTQIIILSTDGKKYTQLTENKLFVSSWIVNKETGTIVVTGKYDSNNNGKSDKSDLNEIRLYDLKTLKMISKM